MDLLQWFINFLIKIFYYECTVRGLSGIKNENISNKELAEKLHKPTIYRQYLEWSSC